MSERDSDIPEEYALHLEHERQAEAPRASREAVFRRLSASLPGLSAIAPGGGDAPASRLPRLFGSPLLRAAGFLAIGATSGAALHAGLTTPRVVYVDRLVSSPAPPSSSSHDRANDVAPPSSVAPADRPKFAPSKSARPSPELDRESTLAFERRLLDQARGALLRGEEEDAERALREHEARFLHGELREEREALFIKVLARSGRIEEARERAQRFHRDFPHSLLSMGVDADLR